MPQMFYMTPASIADKCVFRNSPSFLVKLTHTPLICTLDVSQMHWVAFKSCNERLIMAYKAGIPGGTYTKSYLVLTPMTDGFFPHMFAALLLQMPSHLANRFSNGVSNSPRIVTSRRGSKLGSKTLHILKSMPINGSNHLTLLKISP